jgi:DNA-binding MarR family transcriptional regulator
MESVSDVHTKQRAVIEFLLAENESMTNIHRRLTNVYGGMVVDKSTVSCSVKQLASSEQGQVNVSDLPRSGHPSTAVMPATMQRADGHIQNDWRITTRDLAAVLNIGKGRVDKIIHQLEYSKVCTQRALKNIRNKEKSSAWSCLIVTRLRVTIPCPPLSWVMRHGFITSSPERKVISEVKRWLRQRPAEWYHKGIQAVTSRWHKAIYFEGHC